MSLVAPVVDGEVQDVTASSKSTKKTTSNSTLDKEAFLQLLVAQMKYQDPLEPTSNTEYISQLAQFSALEEMQNVRASMDLQRASGLVGQEVYIRTTDSETGGTGFEHGIVDYIVYENNKAYLSVKGELYSIDDLDSVYDPKYTEATSLAYTWTVALNKLPAVSKITMDNAEDIEELKKTFDDMTDYQKGFITKENQEKLDKYVERLEVLKANQKEEEDGEEDNGEDTK